MNVCITLWRKSVSCLNSKRSERGGVLVEFSLSLIVLWLIVAATLDLGRAFAAAHVLQSAARSAARELALDDAIAWNASFDDALAAIFDPSYLVVDATCLDQRANERDTSPRMELAEILSKRGHTLNLMLTPLMVFEQVSVGGTDLRLLRYPGALLQSGETADSGKPCTTPYTVGIAEVDDLQSRVTFHSVVEEIEPDVFSLAVQPDSSLPAGTVALRLLYPFQAVGLSAWRIVDGFNKPLPAVSADDYAVDLTSVGESKTVSALDARGPEGGLEAYAQTGTGDPIPIYGGSLGLGVQGVLGQEVRPFRRVLTAQAIAPREVIGTGS